MKEYLLGIDIGTSACKLAVFCRDGSVAAQAVEAYPVYYPAEGWAEQDPQDWYQAVCKGIRRLLAEGISPAQITGVGIDGQSWAAVAIGSEGDPLCRTPIWLDTRAEEQCRTVERTIGTDALFRICGNPLKPSYSLPKLLWYRDSAPDVYRKTNKVLQSNSYIVWKLTGKMTQDVSQCYGYQCCDLRKNQWDETICHQLGIPISLFPEIVDCDAIAGGVTAAAAAQCGLLEGTPVVAGGLDAACSTLGGGVILPGQTQEQGGQAGGMSICTEDFCADPRLILSRHVVPGMWLLQGGTTGGGGVVNWLRRELSAAEETTAAQSGNSVFQQMDRLAGDVSPGSDGLLFLPYMAGERSPIWNPRAKGTYYGLDFSKTRGHFYRAALEGVAYSLRHNLETAADAGATVSELITVGGAANSWLWTQIKADITGKPFYTAKADTAAALGAAMLAGVAIGAYSDYTDAVAATVQIRHICDPDETKKELYDHGYATYIALYQHLAGLMQ